MSAVSDSTLADAMPDDPRIVEQEAHASDPALSLLSFLLADEVNLTLVWTSVARTAYRNGAFQDGSQAKARAQAACDNAKKLLKDADTDQLSQTLLAALRSVELALEQLASLALRVNEPQQR